MNLMFSAAGGLKSIDDLLDVLHFALLNNQHSILGLHHNEIFNPDQAHQATLGKHIVIQAGMLHHIATEHIPRFILCRYFPQG